MKGKYMLPVRIKNSSLAMGYGGNGYAHLFYRKHCFRISAALIFYLGEKISVRLSLKIGKF